MVLTLHAITRPCTDHHHYHHHYHHHHHHHHHHLFIFRNGVNTSCDHTSSKRALLLQCRQRGRARRYMLSFFFCHLIKSPLEARAHIKLHVLFPPHVRAIQPVVEGGAGYQARLTCVVHSSPMSEVFVFLFAFVSVFVFMFVFVCNFPRLYGRRTA